MRHLIAFVRSLVFWALFLPMSVIVVLTAILLAPLGERPMIIAARVWALCHRWAARFVLGIRTRVEGDLGRGQALYVFKHESMFETIEVLVLFEKPIVVMKKELTDMFGWGYVARQHGAVPVDRDAGAAAMRAMIAAAREARASGRPIVLFPEGTRVAPGERPPLKAGLAGLYKILDLPVVPVALDAGRIWSRGLIKYPGIVTMRVGETIPPGLPRDEIEARVHAAINVLNDAAAEMPG